MKICHRHCCSVTLAALAAASVPAADAPGAACALLTQAELDEATGSPSGQLPTPWTRTDAAAQGQHVTMHCLPLAGQRPCRASSALSMAPCPAGSEREVDRHWTTSG